VKEWTIALVEGMKAVAQGEYDHPDGSMCVPSACQLECQ
jgi:hypothetical protein